MKAKAARNPLEEKEVRRIGYWLFLVVGMQGYEHADDLIEKMIKAPWKTGDDGSVWLQNENRKISIQRISRLFAAGVYRDLSNIDLREELLQADDGLDEKTQHEAAWQFLIQHAREKLFPGFDIAPKALSAWKKFSGAKLAELRETLRLLNSEAFPKKRRKA